MCEIYEVPFPMLGQRVAASVQSIMGSGLPRAVYSSTTHNFNPIPRKAKGTSISSLKNSWGASAPKLEILAVQWLCAPKLL